MKFYVEVYGCTANKSDATIVNGLINKHPEHILVQTPEEADILIILTCTVISTTEQRMLHRIQILSKLQKKVVIAGCMASVQQHLLKKHFPTALLLPPRKIQHLFEIVSQNKEKESLTHKAIAPKQYSTLIAPIAIGEGCLFSCSYCITHLARGKLFSYPKQTIVHAVTDAIHQGCKEIQLTAQDTASYGLDQDVTLPNLLSELVRIKGEYMIRIGMMNPRTTKKIISELIHNFMNDHIYSFLHLPIQSADNTILEKMNRGYTVDEAVDIIKKCRNSLPEITIATDVIVGFPTETDEQFKKTLHLLKQTNPDIINITRFSARPYTNAKKMKGRIPTEIVKERSRTLTNLCKEITLQRNKQYIDKTMEVLPLKKGLENTVIARSKNYKPVILQDGVALGEKRTVRIINATDTHLVGMLK